MKYHSNYLVSDELEDEYYEPTNFYKKQNNNKTFINKVLIITISIIIICIIFGIGYRNIIYKNSYPYLEKQLEKAAIKYVKDNKLTITNDFFIENSKLNIELKDDCNNLSGVIVSKDGSYQPYLSCDTYKSKIINNNDEYIKLNGNDVVFIGTSKNYQELGYVGNLEVKISNTVSNQKGVYEIIYNVIRNNTIIDTLKRLVIVVDDKVVDSYYPRLSLNGEEIIYLNKGGIYEEKGCNAFDSVDGNISSNVKISSDLDIENPGEYQVIYTFSNTRGFVSSEKRKLIVVDSDAEQLEIYYYITPVNATNDKKTINFYIANKKYKYALLPNGLTTDANNFEYDIYENGLYSFTFYDQNGGSVINEVLIENIDKELPTLSCNAETYENNTIISAFASDNDGISSYRYFVDGSDFGETFSNTYNVSRGDAKSVSVIIKDNAGNTQEAVCSVEDKVIRKPVITIDNDKSYISCGVGPIYNEEMFKYIKYAGYKTREGVVAAAIYLATLPNKIPYFWSGGHYHEYNFRDYDKQSPDNGDSFIGISHLYGCDAKMSFGGTAAQKDGQYYRYGLDCSGFISWAIMNGGYYTGDPKQTLTINTLDTFTSYVGGISNNSATVSQSKGLAKPGDIVYRPGHVGLIIAVDNNQITIAEEAGSTRGLIITTHNYNNSGFSRVILMDNFYSNYQKDKPLWSGFK